MFIIGSYHSFHYYVEKKEKQLHGSSYGKKHWRDLIDAVIGPSLAHSMCTAGSKPGLTMGRVWGKMTDWIGGSGRWVGGQRELYPRE